MNNLTNYHSHCLYCDGVAPAEDFVKEAIAMGFSSYGISSHAPIPFESCWNMKQERLTDYIVEINSIKEKYKNFIRVWTGDPEFADWRRLKNGLHSVPRGQTAQGKVR